MAVSATKKYSSDRFQVTHESSLFGDAYGLEMSQSGGADRFTGASDGVGYQVYGDAIVMDGRSKGGGDTFIGGSNVGSGGSPGAAFTSGSGVQFSGDAEFMFGLSQGGNDTMTGGLNSMNEFYGDASEVMSGRSRGGNDTLTAGNTFAEESEITAATYVSTTNTMLGDSYEMVEEARGGADTIKGGVVLADAYSGAQGVLSVAGDAYFMGDATVGGKDKIFGAHAAAAANGEAYAVNLLMGDAYMISGGFGGRIDEAPPAVTTGADTLVGGNAAAHEDGYAITVNLMAGDAYFAEGNIMYAGDTMTGGSGTGEGDAYALNVMFGDAYMPEIFLPPSVDLDVAGLVSGEADILGSLAALAMPDAGIADHVLPTQYAGDTLKGGATQALNVMVGDAYYLFGGERGGADTLTGGGVDTVNILIGDAYAMDWDAMAGRDKFYSGAGTDIMIGDAYSVGGGGDDAVVLEDGPPRGADTFIFRNGNGEDAILDFEAGHDKIDVSAFKFLRTGNFSNFADMRLEDVGEGVLLHLDVNPLNSTNTVLLVGVELEDLTASSFIF